MSDCRHDDEAMVDTNGQAGQSVDADDEDNSQIVIPPEPLKPEFIPPELYKD